MGKAASNQARAKADRTGAQKGAPVAPKAAPVAYGRVPALEKALETGLVGLAPPGAHPAEIAAMVSLDNMSALPARADTRTRRM